MSGTDHGLSADERDVFRRSVRAVLAAHWPVDAATTRLCDAERINDVWRRLVELGVADLCRDGAAGGLFEAAIVMEECGRAHCPQPMLGAVAVNLLERCNLTTGTMTAHRDEQSVSVSGLARQDGLATSDGRIDGICRYVDGSVGASRHLAFRASDAVLIDVDASVGRGPARALGSALWSDLSFSRASFMPLSCDVAALADVALACRLLLLARARGAAHRAFDLAVHYAKERRQFGQPIGRFQAIQHKLANGLIALEGTRLSLAHACSAFDATNRHWRYFASAALSYGVPALRQVSVETHHAFGAIGYAEEHEAPRHFRSVHLDTMALGGTTAARATLAAHLLDHDHATLPEYDLGARGNAFRDEVRTWLSAHWSGDRKAAFDTKPFHDREFDAAFARDLGATGWLGLGWPQVHGGQARSPMEQIAFLEVMERAEAPRFGAAVQANALIMFGTPEQQSRYLPEILAGTAMHGMGYSEPDAGSDLAALRTRAVRDGDQWVIDGQKIWTTTYWGKYMFLAARTDQNANPAQAGISMFIVPMSTPGITVTPARTMYDGTFANIFYDDVRVPHDALIGPLNGGWKVLTDALAAERGLVGGGIVLKVAHAFELLCRDVRDQGRAAEPLARDRIAVLAGEIEVGRQLMIHCAELATSGTTPPEAGAMSKVFSGELMERFGEAALDILGPEAALSQGATGAIRAGRYEQMLRHSLMWVISIGTNEIQRSLIAQRGLGLPR